MKANTTIQYITRISSSWLLIAIWIVSFCPDRDQWVGSGLWLSQRKRTWKRLMSSVEMKANIFIRNVCCWKTTTSASVGKWAVFWFLQGNVSTCSHVVWYTTGMLITSYTHTHTPTLALFLSGFKMLSFEGDIGRGGKLISKYNFEVLLLLRDILCSPTCTAFDSSH